VSGRAKGVDDDGDGKDADDGVDATYINKGSLNRISLILVLGSWFLALGIRVCSAFLYFLLHAPESLLPLEFSGTEGASMTVGTQKERWASSMVICRSWR
jgi:hypothetical protein